MLTTSLYRTRPPTCKTFVYLSRDLFTYFFPHNVTDLLDFLNLDEDIDEKTDAGTGGKGGQVREPHKDGLAPQPMGKTMTNQQAWGEKESAIYLGLSVKTLQARRAAHKAPPYIKVGRSVRYLKDDLDSFLAACRVDPEARN